MTVSASRYLDLIRANFMVVVRKLFGKIPWIFERIRPLVQDCEFDMRTP